MYNVVTYYPRKHTACPTGARFARSTYRARARSPVGRKHTWRAHGNFWNGKDRRTDEQAPHAP